MALRFFTRILCSLLHSAPFLSLTVGAVYDHILFPNQTLVIGHTLVSQNQVFEMGFFSPGKSSNRFLGIWYKSTPDVVAWVANRNHPIPAYQTPFFMISGNGSLDISSGKSIIWSVNSSGIPTWQSFDYPTDTCLQGMQFTNGADSGVEKYLRSWRNADDPSPGDYILRIENKGLPDFVTPRGTKKRYRLGKWNGLFFGGGPRFPNAMYNVLVVFRQERMISAKELYDSTVVVRVTLDPSGTMTRHTLNAQRNKWNRAFTFPQDTCDEYGICGPNGICKSRTDSPVRCECFKGFAPKFQSYWDHQDWSGGCT